MIFISTCTMRRNRDAMDVFTGWDNFKRGNCLLCSNTRGDDVDE